MSRLGRGRPSPNVHLYGPASVVTTGTAPPSSVTITPYVRVITRQPSRRYRTPHHVHLYGPCSTSAFAAGTLNRTLGPVTIAASGTAGIAGTLARILAPVTIAATGTHTPTPPKIQGTIWTKTLTGAGGSETFTASAIDEASLVYVVLHGATSVDAVATAFGVTDIADSPAVTTVNPDELVLWGHFRDAHVITVVPGSGTNVGPIASSANAVRASSAVNFGGQPAIGASGTRRFAGATADPWTAATISVTGTSSAIATGTLARTLNPVTIAATGTFTQNATGTADVTLGPVTLTATGTHPIPPVVAPTPTLRGALTSYPRLRKGFSAPRLD